MAVDINSSWKEPSPVLLEDKQLNWSSVSINGKVALQETKEMAKTHVVKCW